MRTAALSALLSASLWMGSAPAATAEIPPAAQPPALAQSVKELQAALVLAGAGKDQLEDAAALAATLPKADAETLAAADGFAQRLATEVAQAAATRARFTACSGKKAEALDRIGKLHAAFQNFPAAASALDSAKDEIENEKPGLITGEYWGGAALGAVYYTSPSATRNTPYVTAGMNIAKELGLPYLEIHEAEVKGFEGDANGALLYPDGAPRARIMIMPGGDPGPVMKELGSEGCENLRQAYRGGMDYMGICSGCCLVYTPSCLKLWPGRMSRKAPIIKGPPPDIALWPFHPLARMRKAGPVLKEVAFTGGINEMSTDIPDTEYIGYWRNGGYEGMENKPCLMAYLPPDLVSGRLVVCPAHPEAKEGSFLELMCRYSLRHPCALTRKAVEPGTPLTAVCGDRQNQYYELKVGEGVKKLEVILSGVDGDLELAVKLGEPSAPKRAPPPAPTAASKGPERGKLGRVQTSSMPTPQAPAAPPPGKKPDLKFSLVSPKPGVYFIQVYGNHDRVAGVNYTLNAGLEVPAAASQ